jgi:hypothetical protein
VMTCFHWDTMLSGKLKYCRRQREMCFFFQHQELVLRWSIFISSWTLNWLPIVCDDLVSLGSNWYQTVPWVHGALNWWCWCLCIPFAFRHMMRFAGNLNIQTCLIFWLNNMVTMCLLTCLQVCNVYSPWPYV